MVPLSPCAFFMWLCCFRRSVQHLAWAGILGGTDADVLLLKDCEMLLWAVQWETNSANRVSLTYAEAYSSLPQNEIVKGRKK